MEKIEGRRKGEEGEMALALICLSEQRRLDTAHLLLALSTEAPVLTEGAGGLSLQAFLNWKTTHQPNPNCRDQVSPNCF